ncbi:MAG: hypothetical protein WDZ76_03990 [Pseudohongiellaceae bacterium]
MSLKRNYPGELRTVLLVSLLACTSQFSLADATGGIVESVGAPQVRPALSKFQVDTLIPDRGPFMFPAPYNTEGARLTNAGDCGGSDCVISVGYSYWNNINNHIGFDTMLIFVGMDRLRGGQGPTLLEFNKVTGQVGNLGPLFDTESPYSWASGEGWYFSPTMPTKLYINNGKNILRYDVMSQQFETVFNGNAYSENFYLWQMHTSGDDQVHSASVRENGSGRALGCMVYEEGRDFLHFFSVTSSFDECQIDKSGRWLVIKENVDGRDGEDNRIIDLTNGSERVLLDHEGAGGHSDMGHGYMIAADNWSSKPNAQKLWKFDADTLTGIDVYYNPFPGAGSLSHVSHVNAKPGVPAEQQYACGSSTSRGNAPHSNEIICFGMNDSGNVLVVAPVMTNPAVGGRSNYGISPKGNLDVTGEYFIWTSNMGGNRVDLFLVKVPSQLL